MKKNSLFWLCLYVIVELNFSLVLCQENGVKKLTQQSEFLAPAEIGVNLYKPIEDPVLKRKESSNNLGTTKTFSNQSKQEIVSTSKSNSNDEFDSLMNAVQINLENNVDNNVYGKIQSFDAVETDFERFKNSPCYDIIGFNPTWEMDSLEKEYQDCERKHNFNILMIVVGVIVFLIIIGVIVKVSLPKKKIKIDK